MENSEILAESFQIVNNVELAFANELEDDLKDLDELITKRINVELVAMLSENDNNLEKLDCGLRSRNRDFRFQYPNQGTRPANQ